MDVRTSQQPGYLAARDGLMSGLRQGGEVLVISGGTHAGFTDDQSYYTVPGRITLHSKARSVQEKANNTMRKN